MDKHVTVELGDITRINTDAVVNAANSTLLGGGGVDGAIHRAGGETILQECIQIRDRQGECKPGESVITSAGKLPAKFVIHTVGPVWSGGEANEREVLAHAYKSSLQLAVDHGIKTIAFPSISTGAYRFPKTLAAQIATTTVLDFLSTPSSIESVVFVCFDQDTYTTYQKVLDAQ